MNLSMVDCIVAEACRACGKCRKVCPTGAISGKAKMPHVIDQAKCVQCGSCLRVCPFDAVKTSNIEVEMAKCDRCGRTFAPRKMLEFVRARLPAHVPMETACPACRRAQTVVEIQRSRSKTLTLAQPLAKGRTSR